MTAHLYDQWTITTWLSAHAAPCFAFGTFVASWTPVVVVYNSMMCILQDVEGTTLAVHFQIQCCVYSDGDIRVFGRLAFSI